MSIRQTIAAVAGAIGICALVPSVALASPNLVANGSFEMDAANPLGIGCGVGCSYNTGPIEDWGGFGGLFQPGSSSSNFTYFNSVPDGINVAYSNSGSITQTLSASAVAGQTYTLDAYLGYRNDGYTDPAAQAIELIVGSNDVYATGVAPTAGNWSLFTASFTATVADQGDPITVSLNSPGPQGDFDSVSVTTSAAAVPEPITLSLFGAGLAGAAALRRRKKAKA